MSKLSETESGHTGRVMFLATGYNWSMMPTTESGMAFLRVWTDISAHMTGVFGGVVYRPTTSWDNRYVKKRYMLNLDDEVLNWLINTTL